MAQTAITRGCSWNFPRPVHRVARPRSAWPRHELIGGSTSWYDGPGREHHSRGETSLAGSVIGAASSAPLHTARFGVTACSITSADVRTASCSSTTCRGAAPCGAAGGAAVRRLMGHRSVRPARTHGAVAVGHHAAPEVRGAGHHEDRLVRAQGGAPASGTLLLSAFPHRLRQHHHALGHDRRRQAWAGRAVDRRRPAGRARGDGQAMGDLRGDGGQARHKSAARSGASWSTPHRR